MQAGRCTGCTNISARISARLEWRCVNKHLKASTRTWLEYSRHLQYQTTNLSVMTDNAIIAGPCDERALVHVNQTCRDI